MIVVLQIFIVVKVLVLIFVLHLTQIERLILTLELARVIIGSFTATSKFTLGVFVFFDLIIDELARQIFLLCTLLFM